MGGSIPIASGENSKSRKGQDLPERRRSKRGAERSEPVQTHSYEKLLRENRELKVRCRETGRTRQDRLKRFETHRAILDAQTDLICRFKPDGTFTYVNEPVCRRLGKTFDSLMNRKIYEFLQPQNVRLAREAIASISPAQPLIRVEELVRDVKADRQWWHWAITALFDEQGRPVVYQGVGRDITAFKKTRRSSGGRSSRERPGYPSATR